MNNKTILIPIDETKFDNIKIENATIFLNEFFENHYKCSFIYDDNKLCLNISKN